MRLDRVGTQSVPSLGYCNSVGGAKSYIYVNVLCEFLLAQSSMTWHLIVVFVNYCACFPWFRVTCKCPKCVFCLSTCVQVVEETAEQQSPECAPQNYQVFLFSCCWPKPLKKEYFHPSEFPVIIVLLPDKVVVSYSVHIAGFCAVALTVSMLFVDFVGASNAVLHSLFFTEWNYLGEAGWQCAVQQTHLWLQSRLSSAPSWGMLKLEQIYCAFFCIL